MQPYHFLSLFAIVLVCTIYDWEWDSTYGAKVVLHYEAMTAMTVVWDGVLFGPLMEEIHMWELLHCLEDAKLQRKPVSLVSAVYFALLHSTGPLDLLWKVPKTALWRIVHLWLTGGAFLPMLSIHAMWNAACFGPYLLHRSIPAFL